MLYEQFLTTVKQSLLKELGGGYTITLHQIPKMNGIVLDGLAIGKENELLAPTIYLNSYYDLYQNGMTVNEIVTDILTLYRKNSKLPDIDLSQLKDYEAVKDHIVFQLMNAQSNGLLLANTPYVPFLDLAVVFYLQFPGQDDNKMTSLIHNEHLKLWQVTLEDVYQTAMENTRKFYPAQIKSMIDVMKEIARSNLGDDYREEYLDELLAENSARHPLYVLGNISSLYGAGCILYGSPLRNFAEQVNADLVILPSSIHEVLLIPYTDSLSFDELREMVSVVNEMEVPREDQLSNEIYLYSKSEDRISIIPSSSESSETVNP